VIFAISIGSNGEGDERYVLYIPLSVSPGREISNVDLNHKFEVGEYEIGFEKSKNFYGLTIGPFASEKQAFKYYPKFKSALLWVSLKCLIGLSSPKQISSVTLMDAAIPVPDEGLIKNITEFAGWETTDGYYDADKCVIRPEHKRLIRWETGRLTVIAGLGSDNFIECVKQAMSFPNPENILTDSKLQLAIELYSSFFFEQSTEAKFIKLVTVLEALSPDFSITDSCKKVLDDVKKNIKIHRNEFDLDSDEWKELNHLLSRVGQLKRTAIGSSMRKYISNILDNNPDLGDKEEVLSKLKDLYNHRSKLLHKGETDKQAIQEGLQFLIGFVPKLLELLYKVESA